MCFCLTSDLLLGAATCSILSPDILRVHLYTRACAVISCWVPLSASETGDLILYACATSPPQSRSNTSPASSHCIRDFFSSFLSYAQSVFSLAHESVLCASKLNWIFISLPDKNYFRSCFPLAWSLFSHACRIYPPPCSSLQLLLILCRVLMQRIRRSDTQARCRRLL